MISKEEYKVIAQTILQQMGGAGKIMAMTGATCFCIIEEGNGGVKFMFKGNRKMNMVEIRVNAMDTYDVTYKRMTALKNEVITYAEGLYWDMLKPSFERVTGLYLSL